MAQNVFNWTSIPGTMGTNLSWVDCFSTPLQCTRLNAPLNYSEPASSSVTLALIRIPSPLANTSDYRGPILFNPGGTGGSGVDFMISSGALLSEALGPQFDIVSFDPRGVNNSTPTVSFFLTDTERAAYDFGPHAADPTSSDHALPGQWAQFQVLGNLAQDRDRDENILAHVTTDNVARDMLTIVEAYGEAKLKYWGISYGTVIGATFATIFPDKVERIVIDGVLDMEGYYAVDWRNQILDTDKVLHIFFDECVKAGPVNCAFHANSSIEIEQNLDALLKDVLKQPIPAYAPSLPLYGVLDHAILKNAIFSSFFTPYESFSTLAQGLAQIRDSDMKNGSILFQMSAPQINELGIAIVCSDGTPILDGVDTLEEYTRSIANLSKFSGVVAGIRLSCSGWRIHPDNFKGPVGGNTSFPLLVIGNTADPVTPLAGAKKTASTFPGSVVLVQDSPGHTSFSIPSNCTLGHVQQYFLNGTLPKAGTVCAVDGELFPSAEGDRSV